MTTTDTTTPEVAVAPPTIDLTAYRLVHRALRDGASQLAAAALLAEPGTDARRTAAISRWFDGYLGELDLHHRVEDEIFFPALRERVPVMAQHSARLDLEHDAILESMARTQAAIQQLAAVPVNETTHGEAVAATRELSERLQWHLDYEDADILPLFVRHMTPADYELLELRRQKISPLSTMTFAVPFLVEAASDEERRRLLGDAPPVLKLLWILTRRRHRRLTRSAFGS